MSNTIHQTCKRPQSDERVFEGRIWVEEAGLQVVRSLGKVVAPRDKSRENLFPEFLMKRALVDGYWFPVSVEALDSLHFRTGDARIRELVTFEGYRHSR